jgi:ATP/maltotriose-dependent transcriptional regulator MalT
MRAQAMTEPVDGEREQRAQRAQRALSGRELVVLHLLAVGYSREQITGLLWVPAAALELLERSARAALGVATAEEAVELARRRRLII